MIIFRPSSFYFAENNFAIGVGGRCIFHASVLPDIVFPPFFIYNFVMTGERKKILFINFGGLGDEILFLPSIISVKKEFPNSEITLALEPRGKNITELTDYIDKTLFADIKRKNKYLELIKLLFRIWAEKYDIIVSSGANIFISVFLFLTFVKKRYGYDTGKLSKMLLTKAVKLNKNQYAATMYHDLVRDITSYDTQTPQINITKNTTEPNTVLIHPGVSLISIKKGIIKTVNAQTWAEIIDKLADNGKKIILAGGPDDKEVIEKITKSVSSEKYENYYGKTKSIKDLAGLISKSEIFVCSDSAPLHLAAALGVKTFVIFGPTDDKKLVPQNSNITPVKANCNCPIQPCLWEKRQTSCETLNCLNISAEDIAEKILSV